MYLDAATLRDLEIVPLPATCGTTVWSLVDRTRTRLGRKALRERLLAPPHAEQAILALQEAHQALAETSIYRHTLDRADLDGVEHYLSANWQLPRDMPPAGRIRRWYGQYLEDVERGQTSVRALLDSAAELCTRLSASRADVLRALAIEIAESMETASIARDLRRLGSGQSRAARRAFDQLARGDAKSRLATLLEIMGRLEALWSLGAATLEHGWSYPRPSTRLRVVGLFHPFLGREAVPNDLQMEERVRVCFVTGPNMAGKSTFLKAIGVAMLLAHAGCGVPADSMEFQPVGTIFSSVQITDNLDAGESFYLAEVHRIKALAAALAEHGSAVAVVDEPFRGTNVHDAAEATLAVITRLARHRAALAFVASHVGEIGPAIAGDPRIALLHFAADVTADRPQFDYRLREGVSSQRLGMTLLRQEGVLDLLERSADFASTPPDTALEPVRS